MKDATHTAADAGGVVGPDVVAACALTAVPGMGASSLARLTETFGSLAAALEAGPAKILKKAEEIGLRLRQEAVDFLSRKPDLEELGAWAVETAKNAGARVVVLGDPWYPPLLREIENPPPLLYVRGGLTPDVPRIAVVGARETDDYGLELARDLAEGLARAGVQVVSGGARGVDAAAHAGALWGAGTTCAVLGCGIDIVYPPENAALFDRLANGGGCVVSEFPPNTPASRSNFPRRNRTIAGLCTATVVIRARLSSGALITANHAKQQGRALFAVPGQHGDELSEGPNSLLTAGVAQACTSPEDVLRALGWPLPPPPLPAQGTRSKRYVPTPMPRVTPSSGVFKVPPRAGPAAPAHAQGAPGTQHVAPGTPIALPLPPQASAPPPPAPQAQPPAPPAQGAEPVTQVLARPPPASEHTAVQPPPPPSGVTESAEVLAVVPASLTAEVLDEESMRLLTVLDTRTALHVDAAAARAQLTAATALRKLLELELRGLVVQKPGKYFLRR